MSADLGSWLQTLGLERYAPVLAEHEVDLDALRLLSERDLQELGLPLGPRRKLLRAIADLDNGGVQAVASESPERQTRSEGERRQLTVLFCDLVGYTGIASRLDPEVLQGIVRGYEDTCAACVTRYEGYVFQRLGDGIVAFFGYPLAHEGEAERAIRAGLEIIDALTKLEVGEKLAVRIGVATGLVVVSSAEKGAVGETMNLAARLQAIAQPGNIVVSERVHRLAGGSFNYEDLGEQTLKGIEKPTHAYRILGLSEMASRFDAATVEGLTPLVGREQELGLLLERWALAQEGEGQVVLLSGEPGIGKSRILDTLRERLQAQGAQALRFQCSPYYVNSALWPSIDTFERALKFARDETPESKLDKLEALIVGHYGRLRSDVRFVASLLSIPCEQRYGAVAMTPQKHKDETLRTLVDLTEAAARKQRSVMLFEDAHWADPTTLEVMDLLIDRVKGVPLLIVLTHRPEFQSRWGSHGHVTALNLSKLTRTQSAAMVAEVAGGKRLPVDLLEQILAKTDGVPLFVEELTKSILESGELKDTGDRFEYVGSAQSITIPASLRDSLMARLDRFAPVKEIAQIGAAIGREFGYELVSAVAPMSQAQLDSALVQLTDSGLAFRRGTPPEARYTFKHALVQDAAYDSLLKARRQELHGKIARVIEERFPIVKDTEPEVLAHHLTAASLAGQALPYWLKAGHTAVRRTAFVEAAAHLRKGLELLEVLPPSMQRDRQELDFLSVLMPVHITLTGWSSDELHRIANRARELGERFGEVELLTGIWEALWMVQSCRAKFPESLEVAASAIRAGNTTNQTGFKIVGYFGTALSRGWMGDFAAAREAIEETVANYDFERHSKIVFATNHDPLTAALSWASHFYWVSGWPDQARRAALQQLELARRLNHPFNLIWALVPGAGAFMYRGESGPFLEWMSEATRIAEEQALGFALDMIIGAFGGMGLVRFGRHEEGYEKVKRGVDTHAASGNRVVIPMFQTSMSDALGKMGRADEGQELIAQALARIAETGEGFYEAEAHRVRGDLLLSRGQPREAETAFHLSLEVARGQSAKGWQLRTAMSLARLWQNQGKRKQAYELLAPVYNWFTEGFDTKDLKEVKALLHELEGVRK